MIVDLSELVSSLENSYNGNEENTLFDDAVIEKELEIQSESESSIENEDLNHESFCELEDNEHEDYTRTNNFAQSEYENNHIESEQERYIRMINAQTIQDMDMNKTVNITQPDFSENNISLFRKNITSQNNQSDEQNLFNTINEGSINHYACNLCNYVSGRRYAMVNHVNGYHLQNFAHQCSECDYKTNRKSDFKRHFSKKHLQEEDFELKMV